MLQGKHLTVMDYEWSPAPSIALTAKDTSAPHGWTGCAGRTMRTAQGGLRVSLRRIGSRPSRRSQPTLGTPSTPAAKPPKCTRPRASGKAMIRP